MVIAIEVAMIAIDLGVVMDFVKVHRSWSLLRMMAALHLVSCIRPPTSARHDLLSTIQAS